MKRKVVFLAVATVLLSLPATDASEEPAPVSSLQLAESFSSRLNFVRSDRFTSRTSPVVLPSACSDADADGYSPDGGLCGPTDCNDQDPSVSPGAPEICDGLDNNCDGQLEQRRMDANGNEFCLSLVVDASQVGEPAHATLYGYHEQGVAALRFTAPEVPYNQSVVFDCGDQLYCQFTTTVPAEAYPGIYVAGASLDTGTLNSTLVWTSQAMHVTCPDEYCDPDPLYVDFVDWMREKGYSESIVSFYADIRFNFAEVYQHEVPLQVFRSDLRERAQVFEQPFALTLHDIVPTDTEATYLTIGPGEGLPCEPTASFPDWCNPVVNADVDFVEHYFESVFAMDFEFQYRRTEIDYSEVMGEPELRGAHYVFFPPSSFSLQFIFPDIVYCGMTSWRGLPLNPLSGAKFAAWCGSAPHVTGYALMFSHEWGHTTGLSHSFYMSDTGRVFWRLDGVMDNTYRFGFPPILDLTDPLERYVIEPDDGYLDQATFASEYNDHVIGSTQMKRCLLVDLNLTGVAVVHETVSDITYRVSMENSGNTSASYVRLTALDGDSTGALVAERILDRLAPQHTITHDFTIPRSQLPSGGAYFVLDRENRVQEMSEFPLSGCPNPPRCADADNDGVPSRLGDVLYMVNYVFKSGPEPFPTWTVDFQATGVGVTAGDILYLINHIFKSGPAPVCQAGGL